MMFKKLLEWCDDDDDDEGNEKYDNTDDDSDSDDDDDDDEKETYFMRAETLLPVEKTGVIFIMALHPGLFGVTVSHAGQFLLVVGLSLLIAVIFPCLFREQSLHPSLTELLFQLPLWDGWPLDVNFATKDDVLPQWLTTNLWLGALWRK